MADNKKPRQPLRSLYLKRYKGCRGLLGILTSLRSYFRSKMVVDGALNKIPIDTEKLLALTCSILQLVNQSLNGTLHIRTHYSIFFNQSSSVRLVLVI